MKLSPIKKERVYKAILKQISESIEREELVAGDKLPSERDLAEQLSVSRTAVREAFSVLESSGIIEVMPGVGIFLKKNEKEEMLKQINKIIQGGNEEIDILELLEVRQGIEVQAAKLAAMRRTKSDLKKIELAYKNLEEAAKNKKIAAEEDLDFHIAVVKASHNKMLIDVVHLFYQKFLEGIKRWRIADMKIPDDQKLSRDIEHYNVYQAILEQDPLKAQQSMTIHFENTILSYTDQILPSLKNEKHT